MTNHNQYDVIIIGSGVAGALCAWKLATYDRHRILILEAGDNGITNGQRIHFHHTMDVQGARGDMYAPYTELESRSFAPAPEKAQNDLATQLNVEKHYDYSPNSKDSFRAGYNRMTGGSTWSWRGNCPRFLPSDFKLLSTYGRGRDWPIDYHELEPWYCQAEHELGISGNHCEIDGLFGAFRSQPFPMDGIAPTYSDERVKARLDGKTFRGTKIRVVTTPQARNSRPYDGRPACEGHSNCIPLCPINAKYDATVHLRRLADNPRVELRNGVVVTRLEKGAGGRVTKVWFNDWRSGDPRQEHALSAAVVVIAAHAIESPKILLMSNGLANGSDQVGRNLMDHIQFEVIASWPELVYPFRGPQSVVSVEDFREGAFRRDRSGFRMTIGNDGWGRAGSPATVIDGLLAAGKFGSRLPAAVADAIPRMTRLSFSTEMLADPGNRVELSAKTDTLGIPRPMLTFDIGDYVRKALAEGHATATEMFNAAGATLPPQKPLVDPQTGKMNWNTAAHIMGTCVMGSDPKDSVVNRWGRAHEVPNLWVVGSSVFATSATANPTLTLAALSLRTAAAIHRDMLKARV